MLRKRRREESEKKARKAEGASIATRSWQGFAGSFTRLYCCQRTILRSPFNKYRLLTWPWRVISDFSERLHRAKKNNVPDTRTAKYYFSNW